MSIIRSPRKESNFTIISNKVIRDDRLSYRARGILLDILSRPDNWRVSAEALSRSGKEGRDAILKALNELREFGYIVTVKKQDEMGKFTTDNYVYDIPQSTESGLPVVGTPTPDYPNPVFQGSIEELSKKDYKDDSKESPVRDLVRLYFDTIPEGILRPTGRMVAGQVQNALKAVNIDLLRKLIVIVAEDGMPLTPNTLMIAHKTVTEPVQKPTWTPPAYDSVEAERIRAQATPMPENLKNILKGLRSDLPS